MPELQTSDKFKKAKEESLTNHDEVDFHLKAAFDAFAITLSRIHRRTSFAILLFAVSAFTTYSGLIKGDIPLPGIGIKLDSNSAALIFWAMGIVVMGLRALEFMGYRVLKEKLKLLYEKRYAVKPSLWSYFPPGIVVLMNRFKHLGFAGKVIWLLIYVLVFMPLGISTFKAIHTFLYGNPSIAIKIIIISSLILMVLAILVEIIGNMKRFYEHFIQVLDENI